MSTHFAHSSRTVASIFLIDSASLAISFCDLCATFLSAVLTSSDLSRFGAGAFPGAADAFPGAFSEAMSTRPLRRSLRAFWMSWAVLDEVVVDLLAVLRMARSSSL